MATVAITTCKGVENNRQTAYSLSARDAGDERKTAYSLPARDAGDERRSSDPTAGLAGRLSISCLTCSLNQGAPRWQGWTGEIVQGAIPSNVWQPSCSHRCPR